MGKVLQKKKRMSSIPRATRKPKSKKRHLANPIVAANWNKNETLSQNYRRLGLTAKLNKSSGGVERVITGSRTASGLKEQLSSKPSDPLIIEKGAPAGAAGSSALKHAHVERDPETGAIIRILDIEGETKDNPLNDPLNELEEEEPEVLDAFLHVPESRGKEESEVVRALEEKARNGRRKEPRKQSEREKEWLRSLIDKYGEDYGAMFRDRKLNPMQQSIGDIKARVLKFKKTEGLE